MEDILIKKMTLNDFEIIKNDLSKEFDEFWNSNILENELKNNNSEYIVAYKNSEIVGFAGICYNFDYIEIMNIVVKKNSRRIGIATKLLKKLILISKKYNIKKIGLEVNEQNIGAINLYKKNGFKEIGRRKKYYSGKFDAILMDFYF